MFYSVTRACFYVSLLPALSLHALPHGSTVVQGSIDLKVEQNLLEIKAGDLGIIHWQDFSILPNETVQFIQPSPSSTILNRVTGFEKSQLLGKLSANGKVYLINPNGIVMGKDTIIRAADFLASTLEISDADFLFPQEQYFSGSSKEAIVNHGTIEALDGNVVLLSRFVESDGKINASKGSIFIAAGQEILLKPEGVSILSIRPFTESEGTISLDGTIEALKVELHAEGLAYTQGIHLKGSILALSPQEINGRIYLKAAGVTIEKKSVLSAPHGEIVIETTGGLVQEGSLLAKQGSIVIRNDSMEKPLYQLGEINASGTTGGTIEMTSSAILQSGMVLSKGEDLNGGTISIRTSGPYIETSQGSLSVLGQEQGGTISLQSDTSFFSSGKMEAMGAQGGTITILSPLLNLVSAQLEARGGVQGIGGRIELCGREIQCPGTSLHVTALEGVAGTIFIDPKNIVIDSVTGLIPQYQFIDPNSGGGTGFGSAILALSNGNVVITKPGDNFATTNAGAVYLYNGRTAALISTITGSTSGDQIGGGGGNLTDLTNGNYLIWSPSWDNGGATNAGALTFGNGTTGISGVVSGSNSLIGSTANDQIANGGRIVLTNGNYVALSTTWDNGGATNAGAATFGSGTTGVSGVISASNSLIGSTANDQVGNGGITLLTNGNYVVRSSNWDNGVATNAGAVTFGSGTTGVSGVVSASNSLIGSTADDQIGSGGITLLTNDNYVVRSPNWNNGGVLDAGAVTFGSGTTGVSGVVSASNSLVGSSNNDQVGTGVIALTNGNYVVKSPNWDNGGVLNVGAVTFGNGTTGISGVVSTSNSLVGSTENDQVGSGGPSLATGVTALTNGNYVVTSPNWDNGGMTQAGAATFGDGTTGIVGVVSALNSVVGTSANDLVGAGNASAPEVAALSNGNYVVASPQWNGFLGAATFGNGTTGVTGAVSASNSLVGDGIVGAEISTTGVTALTNGNYVVASKNSPVGGIARGTVTWGNGTTGTIGNVSSTNSLVGETDFDQVGQLGVQALSNGNYVVRSPSWFNGGLSGAGAVTFGNGSTGVVGPVSASNSLIGSTAGDVIGGATITVLANGNYVVRSPSWDNVGATNAGAVTFGSGTTGVVGPVSASNSLVGSTASDQSGATITVLTNGNYLIVIPNWDNGGATNAGAVTFGSGTTGVSGVISASNSLIGSTTNDQIGVGTILLSTNGNYVVLSPNWDDGATVNAGAVTFGNGTTGVAGTINNTNSIIGPTSNTQVTSGAIDNTSGTYMGGFLAESAGIVRVGFIDPTLIGFTSGTTQGMNVDPAFLTSLLDEGSSIVLQANNDITVSSPITSTLGNGALTLSAGRSALINANITTDNGSLIITANDLLSSGLDNNERDSGDALLTIANGVTLDVGAGNLTLSLLNGAGKTNRTSGNLTVSEGATLLCSGSGAMNLTAQDHSIVIEAGALLQTVDGNLSLSAGENIQGTTALTLETTGSGELILISDALFPSSPLLGSGNVQLPLATLTTGGGKLLIYTAERFLNSVPAEINSAPYIPGPIYVDSATEKWGIYFPNSSGIPFTIFYKDAALITARYQLVTGVAGAFQFLENPWYNDFYFAVDPYPPYLTPKNLQMKLPSLVHIARQPS